MKCKFDLNGKCFALCCYSSEKCGSKDEQGNIHYASIEEIKQINPEKDK